MSSEIIMIFGAVIRNFEIEDAVRKIGESVYAYILPDNIDGIPIKKVSALTEKERDGLIVIPSLSGLQDEIYSFLKSAGFHHVEYFHRLVASLPIKERIYFTKMYDWHINFSVPNYERPLRNVGKNLKIYVVTSHANLHKPVKRGGATDFLPTYATPIQAGAALTDIKMCSLRDNVGDNISYKKRYLLRIDGLVLVMEK